MLPWKLRKLWREFFDASTFIYGIDIDPSCPTFTRDAHMKSIILDTNVQEVAVGWPRGGFSYFACFSSLGDCGLATGVHCSSLKIELAWFYRLIILIQHGDAMRHTCCGCDKHGTRWIACDFAGGCGSYAWHTLWCYHWWWLSYKPLYLEILQKFVPWKHWCFGGCVDSVGILLVAMVPLQNYADIGHWDGN